jgi:outer membrane protein TolC
MSLFTMTIRHQRLIGPAMLLIAAAPLLAGCATYHARPLRLTPRLHRSVTTLDHTLPDGREINVSAPLSPQGLAALAVLNDPALRAARAQTGVVQAQIFAAGLLPDPNLQGGFGALLGGPAVAPSIAGSLTQDLATLVTRGVRVRAACAQAGEVSAQLLWQEWQVASQAETLATAIWADQRSIVALDQARNALRSLVEAGQRQVTAGNMTIDQASAARASLASLDAARDAAAQQAVADQAALAALLGISPDAPIKLARPVIARLAPEMANRLIATLARRRPDLIALRYGYRAANADLRAAILAQFPLLSLSVNGGSDTSRVATVGPSVSLNLPLFNGNRGNIAVARATRRQLNAAFTAALGAARGGVVAAQQTLAMLETQQRAAAARLVTADQAVHAARRAYRGHLIDARTETDLINQRALRRTELIALDQKIAAGRIARATLLGAGLPFVGRLRADLNGSNR